MMIVCIHCYGIIKIALIVWVTSIKTLSGDKVNRMLHIWY